LTLPTRNQRRSRYGWSANRHDNHLKRSRKRRHRRGFWKLGRAIGRLEGKVEGLSTRMHGYEKQLEGFENRIDRLDKRINGFLDNFVKQERKE